MLGSRVFNLQRAILSRARFGVHGQIHCVKRPTTFAHRSKTPPSRHASVFRPFGMSTRLPRGVMAWSEDDVQDGYAKGNGVWYRCFCTTRAGSDEQARVSRIYQKKTQKEHILLRPDTYVGSTQPHSAQEWIVEESKDSQEDVRMQRKKCEYVPGLYKIFDEILVNAADNIQRDPQGTTIISVEIDQNKNTIAITNNGRGVPVLRHAKENVYIPELVFGHLLTGSNFDDTLAKVTGGRNGFGAKLTNIFSKKFRIDTVDTKRNIRYQQEWRNNMDERQDPVLTPLEDCRFRRTQGEAEDWKLGDYTRVEFQPDLRKFGMRSLDDDQVLSILRRRVYDLAACNESVKVYLDGKLVSRPFKQYVQLYLPSADDQVIEDESEEADEEGESSSGYVNEDEEVRARDGLLYAQLNKRWQIAVGLSDPENAQFSHVSFVNSIATPRGGTHVNYIADQIVKNVCGRMNRKHRGLQLQPNHVKQHLFLFVNCLVENPSFDSQTKETLTSKPKDFGSRCHISEAFVTRLMNRTRLEERLLDWSAVRQKTELAQKAPRAARRVLGIPKLDDANAAGGPEARKCTLILTEGDSAKALAVAGLSVVGRDHYGVFPLKGKMLNVRDASHQKIVENAEINAVKVILGLNHERTYESEEDMDTLRYGKIMLMTDQDHDGSHIKGLFINFIHHFWPALLKRNDFLEEFVTPILKVRIPGQDPVPFFTLADYEKWRDEQSSEVVSKMRVKYYKGLGTSTTAEAKEYFTRLRKHRIPFRWVAPEEAQDEAIRMAFSKDAVSQRKVWLGEHADAASHEGVDHSRGHLSYEDFVNRELILFSHADNVRSIPSVVDGLKPGQRKVLFAAFKRRLQSEVKVAQFAGFVSEHTAYHHGEASLHSTIVNLAQDYVGSNNLPLLEPCGQFGTRLQGGKDAASARYIYTRLAPHTRLLFDERDDPLLQYLEEDGQQIQPEYFMPVLPLLLVNGAEGLGTGWSTSIPPHHPIEIADNLLRLLEGKEMKPMHPWFRGFVGKVEPLDASHSRFQTSGVVEALGPDTLIVSELPVRRWTADFKATLDRELSRKRLSLLKDYEEHHTDAEVCFVVSLSRRGMRTLAKRYADHVARGVSGADKASKAAAKAEVEAQNDLRCVPAEVLGSIFKLTGTVSTTNMHVFHPHSRHIQRYNDPLGILREFASLRLDYYDRRREYELAKLREELGRLKNRHRFTQMVVDGKLKVLRQSKAQVLKQLAELEFDPASETSSSNAYDYLLNTSLYDLTSEKLNRLEELKERKEKAMVALESTTRENMWREDLIALRDTLQREIQKLEKEALKNRRKQMRQLKKSSTTFKKSKSTTKNKKK